MELRDRQEVDMPPISPKLALEYVDFKKRYEAKDFIVTWKNIVPTYFSAEDFCSSVDEIRKKVKEITNG